jgi:hypothetical protein
MGNGTKECGELVGLESAARELNTTGLKLLMLIREGKIEGSLTEGEWYVTRSSLECFRAHGGDIPATATPSCRTSCKASSCGCG